jgi:hypothetical protein
LNRTSGVEKAAIIHPHVVKQHPKIC